MSTQNTHGAEGLSFSHTIKRRKMNAGIPREKKSRYILLTMFNVEK